MLMFLEYCPNQTQHMCHTSDMECIGEAGLQLPFEGPNVTIYLVGYICSRTIAQGVLSGGSKRPKYLSHHSTTLLPKASPYFSPSSRSASMKIVSQKYTKICYFIGNHHNVHKFTIPHGV